MAVTIFSQIPTIYYREPLLDLGVSNVLDIGCGTGSMALDLASNGINVNAVDINEIVLEVAEFKRKNCQKSLEDFADSVIKLVEELDPDTEVFRTYHYGKDRELFEIYGPNFGDVPEHDMYLGKEIKGNVNFGKLDFKGIDAILLFNVIEQNENAHEVLENILNQIPVGALFALSYAQSVFDKNNKIFYDEEKKKMKLFSSVGVQFQLNQALENLGFEYQEQQSLDLWVKMNKYLDIFEYYRDPPKDKESMIFNEQERSIAVQRAYINQAGPREFMCQTYFGKRLENSSLTLTEAIQRVV